MREKGKDGRVVNKASGADRPRGAARRKREGPPVEEREGDERLRGTVTSVYGEKGYGFLQGADGQQRFFHATASEADLRNLRPGDDVSFIPTQGPKGPRAIEVRLENR